MSEKNYVRIQSNVTIVVTAGLQHLDVTNPDAHVPDRLKVSPMWPKTTCTIGEGVGYYPAYVAKWPTVLALAKDKVLTIGETFDEIPDADEAANAKKVKENLDINMKEIGLFKKDKKVNLEDIADKEEE